MGPLSMCIFAETQRLSPVTPNRSPPAPPCSGCSPQLMPVMSSATMRWQDRNPQPSHRQDIHMKKLFKILGLIIAVPSVLCFAIVMITFIVQEFQKDANNGLPTPNYVQNNPTFTPAPIPTPRPIPTATTSPAPANRCAIENVPEPPYKHLDCDTWEVAYTLLALDLGHNPHESLLNRIANEIYPAIENGAKACGISAIELGDYILCWRTTDEEGRQTLSQSRPPRSLHDRRSRHRGIRRSCPTGRGMRRSNCAGRHFSRMTAQKTRRVPSPSFIF